MPFGNGLASLAEKILPDQKEEARIQPDDEQWLNEIMSSQHVLGSSAIAVNSLMENVGSMYTLARENVVKGFDMILTGDDSRFAEVEETENTIDLYNINISRRLSRVLASNTVRRRQRSLQQHFPDCRKCRTGGGPCHEFCRARCFHQEKRAEAFRRDDWRIKRNEGAVPKSI